MAQKSCIERHFTILEKVKSMFSDVPYLTEEVLNLDKCFIMEMVSLSRVLSLVNKSIKLGTTNPQRIDLALKWQGCDVISPMHCLTSLKKVAGL